MRSMLLSLLVVAVLAFSAGAAEKAPGATGQPATGGQVLRVGVVVAPPFLTLSPNGGFDGIALDLWRDVARDLGLRWRAVEYTLSGLLQAVIDGSVDVGVTDLSITPDRAERMDFSVPYFTTSLGIMVSAKNSGNILSGLLQRLASLHVFAYIGALVGLLAISGMAMWLVERHKNSRDFRAGRQGIGDGLWWSAVTMTSVGYGDKTPRTVTGRMLALVWMFSSVILIAFFTASLTSSLTLETLGGAVNGPQDLYKVRTGVKQGTAAEQALKEMHVGFYSYKTTQAGIQALLAGEIDAFVHDRPVLRYLMHSRYMGKVEVVTARFDPQHYGFAFPPNSSLRKAVNVAMLRRLEDRGYRTHLFGEYLGPDDGH